ncbi:NADH dehydrogenase subunit N [Modicisalibacter ilicicola DSM 19980]|uniref:NADH-quinone oxidoreductase subunit N n=1 Tax=Modicisalibacter ilicicola DSM 19980 TaxID=1121942 RepID=A0A1M5DN07_9GAMM|nr:NADH-quinone oxidoreductase subunit N [Halomonas ilicicola]SHF68350.1 NADH dehydrogenase subunit N [Halomonas ilicicola DSM 19980]
MPIGDLLPETILLVGAVLIVLFASFAPHQRQAWAAGLALVALALAAGFGLLQWRQPPAVTFSGVWALDTPAVATKLLVLLSGAIAVALSPDWMRSDRRHGEYYALCLFTLLGVIMMASANDSMELVVGILLSSTASYPLVAYHRRFTPALEAGMKYFLIGALTNSLLVVGVVLLFGLVGDTDYARTAAVLSASPDAAPLALSVAVACIVLGLTFKLAAFPGHAWMPDVAQGAPAPVAALLTVAPKIGAAVALARFVSLLPESQLWPIIVALIAVVTMTLGNLAALRQTDVRRLLGWSSVSQSGYALMAVVVLDSAPRALPALLAFLAAYLVANLAAFAVVTHLRGRTALADYHGLGRTQPIATAILILALLSLVGIPPLVGFFGKFLLFEVTIAGGYAWLAVIAAVNTVLSLFYYLRVIMATMFKPLEGEVHVLGAWSWLALLASGVLLVVASLGAEAGLGLMGAIRFAG